jgi:hypothetical protein
MGVPFGQCFRNHKHGEDNCNYQVTGYMPSTAISVDVPMMSLSDNAPIVVMPDEYNEGPRPEDAEYIVAAQPAVVLSLIHEQKRLIQRIIDLEAALEGAYQETGYGLHQGGLADADEIPADTARHTEVEAFHSWAREVSRRLESKMDEHESLSFHQEQETRHMRKG